MTAPRYELKYWVAEEAMAGLKAEAEGLLVPDEHGAREDNPSYTVTSLYLDTPDLRYFVEKIEGQEKRKKVRLRRYGDAPDGFIEIKAKRGRRIRKYKVNLDREALLAVSQGDISALREAHAGGHSAAGRLLEEFSLLRLVPTVITRYEREAYLFRDDPAVRVTVDRQLMCLGRDLAESFNRADVDTIPMLEPELGGAGILEVKCSGPLPAIVGSLLRRMGAERKSISKYCLAVIRARDLPTGLEPLGTWQSIGESVTDV